MSFNKCHIYNLERKKLSKFSTIYEKKVKTNVMKKNECKKGNNVKRGSIKQGKLFTGRERPTNSARSECFVICRFIRVDWSCHIRQNCQI